MAADRLVGAVLCLFGIWMSWEAAGISFPILGEGDPGPVLLPQVLGIVIAILGAILCIRKPAPTPADAGLLDDADTATIIPAEPLLFRVLHLINLIAYATLFERLGFSLSTFIFLVVAIFLLSSRTLRAGVVAAVTAIVVTLVVGTGLRLGVGIPLPGVWFG